MSGTVQGQTAPTLPTRYTGPVDYYPGDLVLLTFGTYGTQLGKIERITDKGRFAVATWNLRTRTWGRAVRRGKQQILGFAPEQYVHALGASFAAL